jgi:histone deacetylase 6
LISPSGNGIQKEFYKDPNVLFISLHRFDNGKFYPGQQEAYLTHIGEGLGEGLNVNIPWYTGDKNDVDYIYAFQHVVMPIAYEFDPDFVLGEVFSENSRYLCE